MPDACTAMTSSPQPVRGHTLEVVPHPLQAAGEMQGLCPADPAHICALPLKDSGAMGCENLPTKSSVASLLSD